MVGTGDLDAFFSPQPPASVIDRLHLLKPLFPDPMAEEASYYRRHGHYPIMHVLAVRPELIAREPWLAAALADMYAQAMQQCREYYEDPNYSMFAWAPYVQTEQAEQLAPDLWPSGFRANCANLERFIGYCHDQGLIDTAISVESLFAGVSLDS